jgi:hypothetical protein
MQLMKIRGIAVQAVLPCFHVAHSWSTFGNLGLKRTVFSSKIAPFTLRKAASYRATSATEAPTDRVVDVSLLQKHAKNDFKFNPPNLNH